MTKRAIKKKERKHALDYESDQEKKRINNNGKEKRKKNALSAKKAFFFSWSFSLFFLILFYKCPLLNKRVHDKSHPILQSCNFRIWKRDRNVTTLYLLYTSPVPFWLFSSLATAWHSSLKRSIAAYRSETSRICFKVVFNLFTEIHTGRSKTLDEFFI